VGVGGAGAGTGAGAGWDRRRKWVGKYGLFLVGVEGAVSYGR